ncbi:uncharacterized protein LOC112567372 [Pomacea canaliculata]|uniref:uncharacterized protein LOC112567372 n=1 Tax=Pomacea canaliculata TaxID=400727 RepID=UPI000D7369C5|nr:uncharacterized protein LOC112567372 [Pomacea canaliculata]
MVDPNEGSLRVVTPNTHLSITCFWDTQEFVSVGGVVDTSIPLVPQSLSQAQGLTPGSVVFIIQGFNLPLGQHVVNLTATCLTPVTVTKKTLRETTVPETYGIDEDSTQTTITISSEEEYVTETVMYPIEETICVTVYNEESIKGLRLDHSNSFYDVVNNTTKLTASVATGTELTVQWAFDNEVYIQQVSDSVKTLGFTYPHVWKNPGTFTVYLNVSNRVSDDYTKAKVTVFYPLNGFTFSTSDTILQTQEELVLTLTMASDTKMPMGNVTFNLIWGDGPEVFNVLNVTPGQNLVFRHTYSVQGDRNGSLELVSQVDNKVFTFPVYVWNKLNVTLNISATAGKPGDIFNLTFVNPPIVGFQYIINCSGGQLFSNNQSALYANFSPPVPPYTFSFEKEGEYIIELHAFNLMYSFDTSYIIFVEIPVTGISLAHSNSFYDIVNDTTKLTASVATGTSLTAQWVFGTELYIQQVSDVSILDFTYPHVWKNSGTFTVYLNVSNRVSYNYTKAKVTVFYTLNGFTFSTSDTILQTQEELVLMLTMASDTKISMGNVTFNLTWGDGPEVFNVLNVTPGQNLVLRHTYSVQGDRNGSLELVSQVDNKVFTFPVYVWNKLNVTLNISATAGKPGDIFNLTFVNPPIVGFNTL